MQRPLRMKKVIGFWLFILLLFFSLTWSVRAAEPVQLLGMDKQESPGQARITFQLSKLPDFTTDHSGQRIDLLLKNAQMSAGLRNLPEDESVVKILLAQQHRDFMVSILLRRPPAQVISESLNGPPRIVMDIAWDHDNTGSRPAVAFAIPGMPQRKAGPRARQHQFTSPWAGRWEAFFEEYRTFREFEVPLVYNLPSLPDLVGDDDPLSHLQELAAHGRLQEFSAAAAQMEFDPQQLLLRELMVAESHLRSENPGAALVVLEAVEESQGAFQDRVEYLTAWARADNGQPIMAQVAVQQLLTRLPAEHRLRPAATLLLAEAALATEQNEVTQSVLQTPDNWPEELRDLRKLRLTDARAGLRGSAEPLEAYRKLLEDARLAHRQRFSMNRAAFLAFRQGEFALAADWYRQLAVTHESAPLNNLLSYAAAAAAHAAGDREWSLIELERITLDAPGSEGADRAQLKLIDHRVLNGSEADRAQAVHDYARLGNRSAVLDVREEARFKAALVLYLEKKRALSVEQLMQFRREFASSNLRREADLLLLEQVPRLIEQKVAAGADLKAVVLAEQNRRLLLRGELDSSFLQTLATAFERLGLHQRHARVLLYLFDRSSGTPQQRSLYLPLAESFHKREAYGEAQHYAEQYLERYPQGADRPALYAILLDALAAQQQTDELQRRLEEPQRPRTLELSTRVAWIYWQQGDYPALVEELEPLYRTGAELGVKEMALLAEAAYQCARDDLAEDLYRQLFVTAGFSQQARYRAAQMALRQEQRGVALKLLEEVVETDDDSSWGKLARDLLIEIRT